MLTRRELLGLLAGAPAVLSSRVSAAPEGGDRRDRLGVCEYSYGIHRGAARNNHPKATAFHGALGFLDYCQQLGAGGVQIALGRLTPEDAAKLHSKADAHGMYVEGIVSLPRQATEVDRLDADIRVTKSAGADVVRAALLSGRRYEAFDSEASFRQFAERSRQSLALAEPVLRKHRVRVGIENHKDWRVPELLELVKRLSSEYVGICVDTGNSIALLEDPAAVVEAYAPWAVTTHLKDMAVAEYADGFLLAEVPLGDGFLDLTNIVGLLKRVAPKVRFNLEMITRDPLKVPCLTPKYWATLDMVPGSQLARALAMVRAKTPKQPLPVVTGLSLDEKLQREDENVRRCFRVARGQLGL
jgi:sugar phosphate isomerase/epimerase